MIRVSTAGTVAVALPYSTALRSAELGGYCSAEIKFIVFLQTSTALPENCRARSRRTILLKRDKLPANCTDAKFICRQNTCSVNV